jgi:AcrR family transcriptional regulator
MRKLASALHVSLPTVYAAVDSRNRLVRDVLDVALQEHIREVSAQLRDAHLEPTEVLTSFAEHSERCSWVHDLVAELDTAALTDVVRRATDATSPSVLDRLAERLASDHVGVARQRGGGGPDGAPATLLLLIVLLLDDVARLVAADCCSTERRGLLAWALLDTLLTPVEAREVVATG